MRLFVALNFPEEVRFRIWTATEDLRNAGLPVRWVEAERLHVTLKFIGEVADERAPVFSAVLEEAVDGHGPLTVRLGSLGAFPSLRAPRVLWLGMETGDDLGGLQESVERAVARLGVERDRRDFHPHVTLGRTRRRLRPPETEALLREAEAGRAAEYREEHRAETIELMRSRLGRGGARYSEMSSHSMAGRSDG